MRTRVGLWIDHRKAIIVAITEEGEEIELIISKVEKPALAVSSPNAGTRHPIS